MAAGPCELAAGPWWRGFHWCSCLRVWRGSRLILRFFIVFIWFHGLILLGILQCTRLLFCSSCLSFRCLWTLSPCVLLILLWSWKITHTILWNHGRWMFIFALSCLVLLNSWRRRYSKLLLLTSTRGWTGWICGFCDTCSWGYTRSRDLDRCLCLSPCGGWSSSSSPSSLIAIGISWGSGGEGRGCNRSRDVFPVPTLSPSPAGDGAGGHPGGTLGESGGSWGSGRARGCGPCGPKGTSGSSMKV